MGYYAVSCTSLTSLWGECRQQIGFWSDFYSLWIRVLFLYIDCPLTVFLFSPSASSFDQFLTCTKVDQFRESWKSISHYPACLVIFIVSCITRSSWLFFCFCQSIMVIIWSKRFCIETFKVLGGIQQISIVTTMPEIRTVVPLRSFKIPFAQPQSKEQIL